MYWEKAMPFFHQDEGTRVGKQLEALEKLIAAMGRL
jgi:hypothetical protein